MRLMLSAFDWGDPIELSHLEVVDVAGITYRSDPAGSPEPAHHQHPIEFRFSSR